MFDFLSKAGSSILDGVSNVGSAVGNGLSTVGDYAGAGLSHVAERMQDPEFQEQARLFSAVMSDDQNRYQSALNAYDQRKAEIAKQKREDMQRAEARQQKLDDLKEGRQYSEQSDWLKSYTPESVAAFRETGDKSALVSSTITEMVYDNGIQYQITKDKATGQEINRTRATAYDKPAAPTKSRTQVINGILYEEYGPGDWRPVAGGIDGNGTAGEAAPEGVTLADGQVVNEPGMYEMYDGTLVKVEKAATGKFTAKLPSNAERETYKVKNTAANQSLVDDFDLVQGSYLTDDQVAQYKKDGKAIPKQANGFYTTGISGNEGEAPVSADLLTKTVGSEHDRAVYSAANRIDASMTNMGVAEAKAMGASGINTIAEVKQFAASMPKLDRSSVSALQSSIKKIQTYVNNWNADRAKVAPTRKVGAQEQQGNSASFDQVKEFNGQKYGLIPGADSKLKSSWKPM